jgi:hypothetical protein
MQIVNRGRKDVTYASAILLLHATQTKLKRKKKLIKRNLKDRYPGR